MKKENKDNNYIYIVIVAIVAIIAISVSTMGNTGLISKNNAAGQAASLRESPLTCQTSSDFKGDIVQYDQEGNVMYKVTDGYTKIIPGEGYQLETSGEENLLLVSQASGQSISMGWKCACNSAEGCSGSEAGCERISLGGSGGTECNKKPDSTKCSGSDCSCKERWYWND